MLILYEFGCCKGFCSKDQLRCIPWVFGTSTISWKLLLFQSYSPVPGCHGFLFSSNRREYEVQAQGLTPSREYVKHRVRVKRFFVFFGSPTHIFAYNFFFNSFNTNTIKLSIPKWSFLLCRFSGHFFQNNGDLGPF